VLLGAHYSTEGAYFLTKTPFIDWALENRIIKRENDWYELELPN
jgi:hypothetical protein